MLVKSSEGAPGVCGVHVPQVYCQLWPTLPVRLAQLRGHPGTLRRPHGPESHWVYATLCPKPWG